MLEKIKEIQRNSGINLRQLAIKNKINYNTLYSIFNRNTSISVEKAKQLLSYFGKELTITDKKD